MSFFKKMTNKFEDLVGDKDKKKEEKYDEGKSSILLHKRHPRLTPSF